jgi:hypothetical protein
MAKTIRALEAKRERGVSGVQLIFAVPHGPAMSGAAIETLSVLLADVTCLIYNSVTEDAHLPGILIHDSPREADLGLGIYRSFLRLLADMQSHFTTRTHCPFQYIVTKTTPPPEELRSGDTVRCRLRAGSPETLLLRENISRKMQTDENGPLFK